MPVGDGASLVQWFEATYQSWVASQTAAEDPAKLVPPFLAVHPMMYNHMRQDPGLAPTLKKGSGSYFPILGEHVATYRDEIKIYVTW